MKSHWLVPLAALLAAAASGDVQAASWKTFAGPGFSIAYPGDFKLGATDSSWRWNETSPGQMLVRISLPATLEPKTNFDGAELMVGRSAGPDARADCLAGKAVSKIRIGGVRFLKFSGSDAGMSHYHDITSYRALQGGACYALEYIVHSTALGVYDPSAGLTAFDAAKIKAILERMAGTFRLR